jgi:hypothetical protein
MPPPPVPAPQRPGAPQPPGAPVPDPIAQVPGRPAPAWYDLPAPPARPPSLPGSPAFEARGILYYQTLDGLPHPGTPGLPAAARPHEAFPPASPQPAPVAPTHPPWLRPDSPTLRALQTNRDLEDILQLTLGSNVPAGVKEMTREQAAAATMFKNNMDALDPTGLLRSMGEFGQSYRPEGNGLVANAPIHYMVGGAMFQPPASYHPGTTQMIHSHPDMPGYKNDYPSDADYLHAYFATQGNRGALQGEMFYHPGSDKFFAYEPKVDSTGYPRFHELVNPYDMGRASGGFEAHRPLPDPDTYGHHFINWPEPESGGPPAPA